MKRLILLLALLAAPLLAQNPLTAKFPGALAGDVDFGVACNSAHSTLTANIDASTLSIPVAAGAVFCSPAYVSIDYETMKVCSVSGNTLTVCAGGRAVHGSAASHSNGAAVDIWIDSNGFNQAAAEIKAIENALGVNLGNVASPWLKWGDTIYFNNNVGIGAVPGAVNLLVRGDTSANNIVQQWGQGGGEGGFSAMFLQKTADTNGDFWYQTYQAGGGAAPKIKFGALALDPAFIIDPSANTIQLGPWGLLFKQAAFPAIVDGTINSGGIYFPVVGQDLSTAWGYTAAIETSWGAGTNPQIGIGVTRGGTGRRIIMRYDGSLDFTLGGQSSPQFRMDVDGKVGIGTTNFNPQATVTIAGSAYQLSLVSPDFVYGSTGVVAQLMATEHRLKLEALYNGAATWGDVVLAESGGNVGIGTGTPGYRLDVVGAMRTARTTGANDGGDLRIGSGTYGWLLRSNWDAAGDFAIWDPGDNRRLYIANGGNVRIGAVGPRRQLHIYGVGQASANLTDAGATGGTLYLQDAGGAPENGGTILFGADQGAFAAIKAGIWNGGENTIGVLRILTRRLPSDAVMVPALAISNNGNVETEADFIAQANVYVNGNLYPGDNTTEENLTDWNTVMGTGIYQGQDAAAVGQPEGGWYFLQNIRHTNLGNWWGAQIAYGWNGGTTNKIWYRTIDSGTPAAWWRIPVLPSLADAGRIKVQDVGCNSYYGYSCDSDGNGNLDYADAASRWTGARQFSFVYGGDPNVVIPATTVSNIWKPETIAGGTMTGVWCKTDAGTVTLEMMRSDGGVFASGTCSTTGS